MQKKKKRQITKYHTTKTAETYKKNFFLREETKMYVRKYSMATYKHKSLRSINKLLKISFLFFKGSQVGSVRHLEVLTKHYLQE